MNLVEAHVLDAIRRTHKVLLKQVRSAVKWLGSGGKVFNSAHPRRDAHRRLDRETRDLFGIVEVLNMLLAWLAVEEPGKWSIEGNCSLVGRERSLQLKE